MKIQAAVRLKADKPFKKGDPVRWKMRGVPKEGFVDSTTEDGAFVCPVKEDSILVPNHELVRAATRLRSAK